MGIVVKIHCTSVLSRRSSLLMFVCGKKYIQKGKNLNVTSQVLALFHRPGRLDKILYVGLPNEDDRADIMFALTKSGTKPKLASGVDLAKIARSPRCEGFSGADLAALVREASVAALKEMLKESEDEVASKEVDTKKRKRRAVAVGVEHFEAAFEKVAPSIGPEERKKYDALKSKLSKGRLIT